MSPSSLHRSISLALTTTAVLVAALAALALSGGRDAAARGSGERSEAGSTHASAARPVTQKELAFRNDMRRLWEDHVTWTRLAVISLTTGSPDTEATVGRLLRNQADIGDALKPFFGEAAGDELTRLLREHILIAADLILAAKAGDGAAVVEAQARWTANADEIAGFLAAANPRFWKVGETRGMLHRHLSLTTTEVVARLEGDWAADVAAYDEIHLQALEMADVLSTGIVGKFPRRFAGR